ncbi:MAG TPA: 2OG-Fe(II) oxygenase [Acetobacteraceae bacterium]|nr:2OG-Fe(II) oxygenase [Acetobacteraceae bacterium]
MSAAIDAGSARLAAERIEERVAAFDWPRIRAGLDSQGWAMLPRLLTARECGATAGLYDDGGRFRSTVVMARHGFGRGEYKYFAYPLPELVAGLRGALYSRLAPVANCWNEAMGIGARYPEAHAAFLQRCHHAGQVRPTPLLLRYGEGDYNCLHQDLYGEHVFPLQVAVLLSEPGEDFEGGEFVLTEQRPRMQSRASVVPLRRGDAVAFAVHHRPVRGTRGFYRTVLRHGVSALRSGRRHTLGIIFHDAA